MARSRTVHRCSSCDAVTPRWQGRCPGCGLWNTLAEEPEAPRGGGPAGLSAEPLDQLASVGPAVVPTGQSELDRVLGGGLVAGSVTLLGGEPGIGKSTLLLQAGASLAVAGHRVLYLSAEESAGQVRDRAGRLSCVVPGLWLAPLRSLEGLDALAGDVDPAVVLVDSIQAVTHPGSTSAAGSVAQVRECASDLARLARERSVSVVLVGHVTKEGSLAGPKVLEHLVDTVISFEGDSSEGLRILRVTKHRFGATNEVGVMDMGPDGLSPVDDPSGRFLSDRRSGVPGSVVAATMSGRRPVLVELQALVGGSAPGSLRRTAQGLDSGRLALLLAVLERRMGLGALGRFDVHTLAVGGFSAGEPGTDLALALSVTSALCDTPLPDDLVAFGEIGLGGEVRRAARGDQRAAEAERLGYSRILCPTGCGSGRSLVIVSNLAEAFAACGLPTGAELARAHLNEVAS